MIRRICFSIVLCIASLAISRNSSAQVLIGSRQIKPLHRSNPMLHSGRIMPLARKFFPPADTFDYGVIPQAVNLYCTMDIQNTSNVTAYLDAEPPQGDYNGFEMWPLFDDEDPDLDGSIDPKATSKIYYYITINPYWYQLKYPKGGVIKSPYYFYYTDYDFQTIYEQDPAFLIANPLSFDTSGPMVMKLTHAKTQSISMLLTDDDQGHVPVDVFNLDSSTQYFILENAEKDSLEVTTAQCWGNITFVGSVPGRTLPFKLGPGEQVLAAMHFEPSTPDTDIHPQTGQEVHFYYDEFVVATDATLGVKFQSNATSGGYKPSRTRSDSQPVIDVIHPDPATPESAEATSTYHIEWNMNNVPKVNIDYSYHISSGIPTWHSVAQDFSGTFYDWTLPAATGTVDVRISPVDEPTYAQLTNLTLVPKTSGGSGVASVSTPTLHVYPNPVAKRLHINNVHETVYLVDMLGRNVMQTRPANGAASFDCSQLPVGNYLVRIGNDVRPITIAR